MILDFEPEGLPEHAIERIEVDGRRLTVIGVFDQFGEWIASVELTDEQRAQLHEATAP